MNRPSYPCSLWFIATDTPGLCMKTRRYPRCAFNSFSFIDKSQDERLPASFTSVHASLTVTMSGAGAVVGLVLGVLPLLVSTAEYYDDVFRPFRRYMRLSKELKNSSKNFRAQNGLSQQVPALFVHFYRGGDGQRDITREEPSSKEGSRLEQEAFGSAWGISRCLSGYRWLDHGRTR